MVDQPPFRREVVAAPVYISWGAVIAGAIAASALTFVFITFGAAIGLAIASPSATWRDTSVALALLSGLWLLLTAVASSPRSLRAPSTSRPKPPDGPTMPRFGGAILVKR